MPKPVIAVHGGAWAIPPHLWDAYSNGVKSAVVSGYKILENGGSALDAVENAVRCLEDNPVLNAGTGSVLTYEEQVEMDALIMDGRNLKVGAVCALKNIRNPVSVARLVMEKTPHVLLAGEGANKFALSQGIQEVHPDDLVTQVAKERLATYRKFKTTISSLFSSVDGHSEPSEHDTVGCAALDQEGHVACGTSTGGITAKFPGRVGDSPLVGAGGMADDEVGAVSTTGHGEAIARVCLAKTVLDKISSGMSSSVAIKSALQYMETRVQGFGGAIAVSVSGEPGAEFSTERMAWAYIKEGKLHHGLQPGEHNIEDI